ncbi:hypothetical protein [Peloplasma aerotolerans]|uniref:Uncharacterized protein n=1 Tax=Peloplasma aerotolerans TaxID=3044389 RepID=A0AAW6UBF7_9MOLU|nr:hypothetical protein [Mariniplasma sp. M4Ah]MDI6452278.1 hypothetical protein [Mariniplasma sp. M4Ah]
MKNAVKYLTLFLVMGLLFTIAACKQDDPTPSEPTPTVDPTPTDDPVIVDFNVLGNWADDGDGVYTITTNTAAELEFSYAKGTFPNASMSSALITEDLSVYKKLVITVEGAGTMLLRLETSDSTPTREVGLNVTGIQGTYEWNLINAASFLEKVNKITIIAAPDKEDSIGVISLTKLMFQESVADGFIINDGFNNIPTNVNEYNGTDEIFNFNDKWENFAEETYTIVKDGDVFNVDFTKGAGFEWSAMQSKVQGTFTDFNFVVVKVSGTAGQPIIVKAADGVETRIILSGEIQEVVVDISEMAVAQKNAIQAILIFGNAGRVGSGSFTIHEAFMIDDYDYEAPVFVKNIYNGIDSEFAVGHWFDGGDVVYTITEADTEYHVEYSKLDGGLEYANMQALIEGDFSNFAKIEFEITGQNAKTVLLKVEGTQGVKEVPVTFDGTRQVIVFDLMTMTPTQLDALNKLVIFAAPGGIGAGEFTIHSVKFLTSDYDANGLWEEVDADTYDITFGETTTVAYTKVATQEWAHMRALFDAEDVAGLNTLTIVIKGEVGKEILIKPNDDGAIEQSITFIDTDPVTLTFKAETFVSIILFAEPNVAPATGTFEIISVTLSYVIPEADFDPTLILDINNNWEENDPDTYDFTYEEDGSVTVDYDKTGWAFMKQTFNAQEVAGLNTMTIVFEGTVGKQIMVKPNDSNALEQWITFTEDPYVLTVFYENGFTNLLIFAEPDTVAMDSFTIISATLSYSVDINSNWEENDPDTYDFTYEEDGTVTVDYDKTGWAFMKQTFDAEAVAGMNTMTIVFEGTVGKQILVKPNDSGALEQWITFTEDSHVMTVFNASGFMNVLIFAEPDTVAMDSFTIVSAMLSYVMPEVDFDPTLVLDVNANWEENDLDTYDFTYEEDGSVTVDYDKSGWAFMKQTFDAEEVVGLNTLTMVFEGSLGKQIMVKPNDSNALEQWITFTADPHVLVVRFADGFTNVLIFAEPDTVAMDSFTIVSATLSYTVDVNSNWEENDLDTYDFTYEEDGSVTVDYDKTGWAFMKQTFDAQEVAGLNTLTIVLEGTVGKQIMVKPNDSNALEEWITFADTDPVTLTFTAESFMSVLIFAEPDTVAAGTFTIVSATLSYVAPVVLDDLDVTLDWADNGDSVYTFTEDEGTLIVDYVKVDQGWSTAVLTASDTSGYNKFTITMTGTEGKQVLVKVNDAIENWVTFDVDGNGTATITAPNIHSVLLFAEGGVDTVTGSFIITSAILSYE